MAASEFPILRLTQKEYDAIPRGEDQPTGFLYYAPIGARFTRTGPNKKILLHIVEGLDAFADQIGACILDIPKRFANRYSVEIVPE